MPTAELPGIGGPVDPSAPLPGAAPVAEIPPTATSIPLVDPPLGIINTELVNGRGAPDTNSEVVLVLGRGEEYDITGKSADGAWWRLCCAEGREVWAKAEFVDTDGLVDSLPVANPGETSAYAVAMLTATAQPASAEATNPTATPAPQPVAVVTTASQEIAPVAEAARAAEAPPADAAQAAGSEPAVAAAAPSGFELVAQERFPETNVVRVFLYVYAENLALEGYSLRVVKDGAEQAVSGESWGGQPGLTWPIVDERQRFQNYKAEFPGVPSAGVWTVELTQGGAVVGPAATFTLEANDANQEIYVRYLRK